jgi:hypothetical protein
MGKVMLFFPKNFIEAHSGKHLFVGEIVLKPHESAKHEEVFPWTWIARKQ